MSITEYPDLEQGTEEWLEARRGIVTASVVGQLLTIKPPAALDYICPQCNADRDEQCWSMAKKEPTPVKVPHSPRTAKAAENPDRLPSRIEVADNDTSLNLTALLVSERITGWVEPTYTTFDMQRGIDDEPRARDKYAEHFGVEVREAGFLVLEWGDWRLGYSPDGLVGDDGLIEVKSRRPKTQVQTVLADEVPAVNMAQIQAGLLVTGRKWLDYVSYAGGLHMYVKRIHPDLAFQKAIVSAVEQFEKNAVAMATQYHSNVAGLPMTERVVELEMVI